MTVYYDINFSDGSKDSIKLKPREKNNYSTSITLMGMDVINYGEDLQKNFLHLLENFADGLPPKNPIEGQLWYDTTEQQLKYYDITNAVRYNIISVVRISNTQGKFIISGNRTSLFPVGERFQVIGSANAGSYYVVSSNYVSGNTEIVVNGFLDDTASTGIIEINNWNSVGSVYINNQPPSQPSPGQIWFDNDPSDDPWDLGQLKVWDGSQWVSVAQNYVRKNGISTETITCPIVIQNTLDITGNTTIGGQTFAVNVGTNRVGLGTTTPAYQLHLWGTNSEAVIQNSSNWRDRVSIKPGEVNILAGSTWPRLDIRNDHPTIIRNPLLDLTYTPTKDYDVRIEALPDTPGGETLQIAGHDGFVSRLLRFRFFSSVAQGQQTYNAIELFTPEDSVHINANRLYTGKDNRTAALVVRTTNNNYAHLDLQANAQDTNSAYTWRMITGGTNYNTNLSFLGDDPNSFIFFGHRTTDNRIKLSPAQRAITFFSQGTDVGQIVLSSTHDTLNFRTSPSLSSSIFDFSGGSLQMLHVRTIDNGGLAEISVYGPGQGDGSIYVGQSFQYGGGMIYFGDATSSYVGLPGSGKQRIWDPTPTTDRVTFFRRQNSINYPVFDYGYTYTPVSFYTQVRISPRPGTNATLDLVTDSVNEAPHIVFNRKIDSGYYYTWRQWVENNGDFIFYGSPSAKRLRIIQPIENSQFVFNMDGGSSYLSFLNVSSGYTRSYINFGANGTDDNQSIMQFVIRRPDRYGPVEIGGYAYHQQVDIKTVNNSGLAELRVYGSGGSDANIYVGQDAHYGGGIFFSGYGTSNYVGTSTTSSMRWSSVPPSNEVVFYRANNKVHSPVISYSFYSDNVKMAGNLSLQGNRITLGDVVYSTSHSSSLNTYDVTFLPKYPSNDNNLRVALRWSGNSTTASYLASSIEWGDIKIARRKYSSDDYEIGFVDYAPLRGIVKNNRYISTISKVYSGVPIYIRPYYVDTNNSNQVFNYPLMSSGTTTLNLKDLVTDTSSGLYNKVFYPMLYGSRFYEPFAIRFAATPLLATTSINPVNHLLFDFRSIVGLIFHFKAFVGGGNTGNVSSWAIVEQNINGTWQTIHEIDRSFDTGATEGFSMNNEFTVVLYQGNSDIDTVPSLSSYEGIRIRSNRTFTLRLMGFIFGVIN